MEGNGLADVLVVGFALHLIKAVRALDGEDGGLFNLPGDVGRGVLCVQAERDVGRSRFFQGLERGRQGSNKSFVCVFLFNTQPHQQNALGDDIGYRLQQQGATAFAGNIARRCGGQNRAFGGLVQRPPSRGEFL